MKKLALVLAFLGSGYLVYQEFYLPRKAPSLAYKDVNGGQHSLKPPCKAAVITFWRAAPSARYDRALAALELLRKQHAESRIDIVAIALDRMAESDVAAEARQAKRTVTMAVAQTGDDAALRDALIKVFKPRDPGDDLYVVDADGVIHHIDASAISESPASLAVKVETVLNSVKL